MAYAPIFVSKFSADFAVEKQEQEAKCPAF